MSLEKHLLEFSALVITITEEGIKGTESQLINAEKFIQQNGLQDSARELIKTITITRQKARIEELELENHELKQRKEASSTLPD